MPAQRLNQQTANIRRFDVVGQDSEGVVHFVRHLGLSSEQRDQLHSHDTISLTYMGPPLEHGSAPGPVHSLGTVPLTADEIQQINVFVDELISEYRAHNARDGRQYVIRPHVQRECAADGTVLCLRFNCAGFVIEAYRLAGINLVLTADDEIPGVSLETLVSAYPDMEAHLHNPKFRSRYNLSGDGPWPVVLAGYVLNALVPEEAELRATFPYQPAAGDEFYPSRREG